MSILRYTASADTTITNAYKSSLSEANRATGSNMGEADSLEVFSIYGQTTSSAGYSAELSRALLKFPVATISADRAAGTVPASGSVNFYLRLFNVKHPGTLPKKYYLTVAGVINDWEEGLGLDMETYSDKDEANWITAASSPASGSATVTVVNEGWVEVGDTISMITTDGTTIVCTMHGSTTTSAATSGNVQAAIGASTTATATNIATAINHNTKLEASSGGTAVVTITQLVTGYAGNTAITITEGGATGFAKTDFTGGTGDWAVIGGDFHTGAYSAGTNLPQYSKYFEKGDEDLELDVTSLVEEWIATDETATVNYGLGVFLSASYETYNSNSSGLHTSASLHNLEGAKRSYYTKKFSARGTEFYFKRPLIEARWNSANKDDAGNFYLSSSMLSATDNLNSLFFYNYYGGHLRDLPTGAVTMKLYSDSNHATAKLTALSKTAGEANTRKLTITDADENSVDFTIDNSTSTSTATVIAFSNANSNASQFATNIAAAINAADTANTLDVSATASGATVILTMNAHGTSGNSVDDIAGTAVSDSVITVSSQFAGGASGASVPTGSALALPRGGDLPTAAATQVTATKVETGIYSASFAYASSSLTTVFPVWKLGSTEIHTGSAISVATHNASNHNPIVNYVSKIKHMKPSYSQNETARFRVNIRQKDWSPTIYTVASADPEIQLVESASFKVMRLADNLEVISYGTGSDLETQLSYDVSGSYFDLDMSMLEVGYMYGVHLAYYLNQDWVEQPEVFKFRVD